MNWATKKNGELLKAAERNFEVLITTDQNMKYQQNLKGRQLGIIVLPTNFLPAVLGMAGKIAAALTRIQPGEYVEIMP